MWKGSEDNEVRAVGRGQNWWSYSKECKPILGMVGNNGARLRIGNLFTSKRVAQVAAAKGIMWAGGI